MSRKTGPMPEEIAEARSAYEGGESIASIARRLRLRRATLSRIRDRECWTVQVSVQMLSASEAKAARERATATIIDMASRRVIEQAQADGTVDDLAAVLRRQNALAAKLTALAESLVADVMRGSVEPAPRSSYATLVAETIEAAERAQMFARTAAGCKPGQPNAPEPTKKTYFRRFIFKVAEGPPLAPQEQTGT